MTKDIYKAALVILMSDGSSKALQHVDPMAYRQLKKAVLDYENDAELFGAGSFICFQKERADEAHWRYEGLANGEDAVAIPGPLTGPLANIPLWNSPEGKRRMAIARDWSKKLNKDK